MSEQAISKLVDRFLSWPLPASVCSDMCATKQGYPHRSGTTLLSADEAKQMIEYLLGTQLAAPAWSQERPTVSGWYWWRIAGIPLVVELVFNGNMELMIEDDCRHLDQLGGEWSGPLEVPK